MTQTVPDQILDQLSAYVDKALSAGDMAATEALIASDPAVAAEYEAMMALEAQIGSAFGAVLEARVPDRLAAAVHPRQQKVQPANANQPGRSVWGHIAAGLVILGIGLGGGYLAATLTQPEPTQVAMGWKAQVADYHRVYAGQTRHLVEVPASEKDHIETWLTKTVGIPVRVPDLSASGYTFQGARLLVAAGKPVFQLVFTDANGTVIALCGLPGGGGDPLQVQHSGEDLQLVGWQNATTNFVLVGPQSEPLAELAARIGPEL